MQEIGKSSFYADQNWYDLLLLAHSRFGQNSRKLSKELGIPFTTLLSWLNKKREPKNTDLVKSGLLAYFEKPYISGPNPSVMARIWQAMRCMKQFSDKELIAVAQSSKNYCQQVIKTLHACDYLKLASAERRIFVLVRDTGPKPPTINKKRTAIIDNNLNQEISRVIVEPQRPINAPYLNVQITRKSSFSCNISAINNSDSGVDVFDDELG